jgi:hypothetical protein
MVSQFLVDFSIATMIVAFSSSATYAMIQWFRKTKRKKAI